MSPLEFMQRLVALVPLPRLHLIRFHGVPALNTSTSSLLSPKAGSNQARNNPARVKKGDKTGQTKPHHA
jgi:putative transposase